MRHTHTEAETQAEGEAGSLQDPSEGLNPGSWDPVPHWAPHGEPPSPFAYVSASLCVSLMNK